MVQRITIRNFGPIPFCDLEIKDFMLLIGEQSTGKSTICKCVYFFKALRDEVKTYLHGILDHGFDPEKRFPWPLNTNLKSKFVNLFGFSKFKGDFLLRYEYSEDLWMEITVTKDGSKYLDLKYSDYLVQKIHDV